MHKVINTSINKIIYYSMYMKKVVSILCTKQGGGGRMNVGHAHACVSCMSLVRSKRGFSIFWEFCIDNSAISL